VQEIWGLLIGGQKIYTFGVNGGRRLKGVRLGTGECCEWRVEGLGVGSWTAGWGRVGDGGPTGRTASIM